jgi:hypothetical protein
MEAAASPDSLANGRLVDLGGPAMDHLRAHLDSISGLTGERLQAARELHGAYIRSLLVQLTADTERLTMVSADWQEAMQAVRADWERLPALSTGELEALMPEHLDRVRRLMELHRERMAEAHMG